MTTTPTVLRPTPAQRPVDLVRRAVCVMPAEAASVPALRRFARGAARRWELTGTVDEALALVVTELVTNAVRHSGSPDVAMLLTLDELALTVQVKDSGRWRPRHIPGQADGPGCTGRGLQLVEAYAAGWALWRTPAGTRVVAELLLPETPPHTV